MSNKLISVIVTVYNIKEYIEECIESILNQTYKNIEILIIDDGSSDGSSDICDKYSNLHNIRVFHNVNQGVSKSRNFGIDQACGEYISFIDGDDYLKSDMYEKMINAFDNDVDIVICGFEKKYENNSEMHIQKRNNLISYIELINNEDVGGYLWNKLYKTSIIKNNDIKFVENLNLMEDLVFNCMVAKVAQNYTYIEDCLYIYRQREGSALNNFNSSKKYDVLKAYPYIINTLEELKYKQVYNYKYKYILYYLEAKNRNLEEYNKEYYKSYYDKLMNDEKILLKNNNFKMKIKILLIMILPSVYYFLKGEK